MVVSALRSGDALPGSARASDGAERSPTERIFEHWAFMLAKNARRTALGPARRKTIDKALALYDEETLLLAVEGCAASAWHAGENERGRPFNDLELILRDEAHIERFAAEGEALRERVLRDQARSRSAAQVVPLAPADPAQADAIRALLRATAARCAGRVLKNE